MFGKPKDSEPDWIKNLKERLTSIQLHTGHDWRKRVPAALELVTWLLDNAPFTQEERAALFPEEDAPLPPSELTSAEKKSWKRFWKRKKE